MKPKYWAIIILIIIAGIVSWYYYLTSQAKLRTQCITPALLEEIKKYPKPDSKGCPKGYFVLSLLCAGSPIWCEPEKNTSVSTSTPSSVEEMNDWKIYVNKEYGFEIKYPEPEVKISENPTTYPKGASFVFPANNFRVIIDDNFKGGIKDYLYLNKLYEKISADGFQVYSQQNASVPNVAFIKEHNKKVYILEFAGSTEMNPEKNLILASFIFLN